MRQVEGKAVETYRCQGTEALVASEPLHKFDPRQFTRELAAHNVKAPSMVSAIVRSFWLKGLRVLGLRRLLVLELPDEARSPSFEPVGLKAGDLVRVKSREEVAATLNREARNRGLSFSPEMVPYCGGTYRVRDRVERLIDEKTGRDDRAVARLPDSRGRLLPWHRRLLGVHVLSPRNLPVLARSVARAGRGSRERRLGTGSAHRDARVAPSSA